MKLTLALATGAAASGNMNGPYTVSSGAGKTGVAFNSDYASKGHEYFDVYSPELATQYARRRHFVRARRRRTSSRRYAEVFWTDMGKQPIPQAIIDRFANKTMASTRVPPRRATLDPAPRRRRSRATRWTWSWSVRSTRRASTRRTTFPCPSTGPTTTTTRPG